MSSERLMYVQLTPCVYWEDVNVFKVNSKTPEQLQSMLFNGFMPSGIVLMSFLLFFKVRHSLF